MILRHAHVTEEAPTSQSPHSQAVSIGNLVAVSGQVALDPDTGRLISDKVEGQAAQVLKNLEACLVAAGASMDSVLRVGVFLANRDDFAAMDNVYRQAFAEPFPARTTVFAGLGRDMLIQIDALAVKE